MTSVPLWAWIAFNAALLGVLAIDLGVVHRRPHVVQVREAATWTAVWVALALAFAGFVAWSEGLQNGVTLLTGYAIEQALSIDNVFVIALILAYFHIPPQQQHRLLFWGVLGALVMRGTFIAAGAFLLTRFGWVQYVMGAILVLAAVRMPRRDAGLSLDRNPVLRTLGRILPLRTTLHGSQMLVRDPGRGGRWSATPLFVALVLVELSDIAFAIDSIPAIFSITRDPFLVYTSNVLAVLGLRSLYFVLAAAVRRFRFLPHGVAVILAFVGVKMLLTSVVAIPTGLVLLVVVGVLTVAVAASMSRLGRPGATDS